MMKVSIRMPVAEDAPIASSMGQWAINDNGEHGVGHMMAMSQTLQGSLCSITEVHRWLVGENDEIKPGQAIAEIVDDAGLQIFRSPHYGVIISLQAQEGDLLRGGQALCTIADRGDICSNRGGPRFKNRPSFLRHQLMAEFSAKTFG